MRLTVYCDASFDRRSRAGGLGVYVPRLHDNEVALSVPASGLLDCNHGEVAAFSLALSHLKEALDPSSTTLAVYTDSDHLTELLEGRRGTTPARQAELELFTELLAEQKQWQALSLVCLKSHRQHGPHALGNERADRLAKRAMRTLRDGALPFQ